MQLCIGISFPLSAISYYLLILVFVAQLWRLLKACIACSMGHYFFSDLMCIYIPAVGVSMLQTLSFLVFLSEASSTLHPFLDHPIHVLHSYRIRIPQDQPSSRAFWFLIVWSSWHNQDRGRGSCRVCILLNTGSSWTLGHLPRHGPLNICTKGMVWNIILLLWHCSILIIAAQPQKVTHHSFVFLSCPMILLDPHHRYWEENHYTRRQQFCLCQQGMLQPIVVEVL